MSREAGKGCKPRPFSVPQKEFDNRWDAIFSKNKKVNEKVNDESSSNNTDNRKSETK